MLGDDCRAHFISALRQQIGGPVPIEVARILWGIEKMAVDCLHDVIPPTLDLGSKLAHAPYSKPRWELTMADGPCSVGELLTTLERLYKSAENGNERFPREKIRMWHAADVLRCCIEIRRHGLNQRNLDWLADAMNGLPALPTAKAGKLKDSSPAPVEPPGPDTEQATSSSGPEAHDLATPEPRSAVARLRIERRARRATLDGRSIRLSKQSFELLLFLAERALASPETVDVRSLEKHVWDSRIHRISSSVSQPVRALRDALAATAENKKAARALIENTRNPNGYRLDLRTADIEITD